MKAYIKAENFALTETFVAGYIAGYNLHLEEKARKEPTDSEKRVVMRFAQTEAKKFMGNHAPTDKKTS